MKKIFLLFPVIGLIATSLVFTSCGDDEEESVNVVNATVSNPDGSAGGHGWVDLGLPSGTLWATCNVGASKPEESGYYYAWGETQPKNDYRWKTYKYYDATNTIVTKYCTDSSKGAVDNKTELEAGDDAATANWGAEWQMPSLEQFSELINNTYTISEWTTMNGVQGRKITSKSNEKSIFLPTTGYHLDAIFYSDGTYGYYWSRSLAETYSFYGSYLDFRSGNVHTGTIYRYYGQSVRPVRVQN